MKQIILLFFISLFAFKAHARRRGIPVCIPCEKIALVKDLPDDEYLQQDGSYLNLGYLHNEYGIIFIPAWNSGGKYVLTNEDQSIYYEVDEKQLAEIKEKYELSLSSNPLSLWKKIGGKLIYLIVIGYFVYSKFISSNEDDEEETTTT